MVDGVERDLGAALLGVGVGDRLEAVVGGAHALGLVDAELHRGPGAGGGSGLTAAGGEQVGPADRQAAQRHAPQDGAA